MLTALSRLLVFARPVVMAAFTNTVVFLAAGWLAPRLNEIVAQIAINFGVDESTAEDIAANEFLIFAESVGVTAATLKTRLPARIADRLGFTTKGYTKRALKPEVAAKVARAKGDTAAVAASTQRALEETAQAVSRARGIDPTRVLGAAQILTGFIGVPIGVGLLITNAIDFAAWNSSAYQGTFQRLFAKAGLFPDKQYGGPRVASQEVFDKVFFAMQSEGATTITHPDTGQLLEWNRQNALAVTEKLASKIFIETGGVSAKNLLGATLALTNFSRTGAGATQAPDTGAAPSGANASASAPALSPASPTTRVFTGVVSQGTLGSPTSFAPRQDDLIVSLPELQEAAINNLAPFIAALPGRVIYEIKIVSSIQTASGFTQRGTAQQVQVGTFKDGRPKFRTVVNKFAVMNLYILTKSGTRSNLGQIVLGPTDAISFQPSAGDLAAAQDSLRSSVASSDLADVQHVVRSSGDVAVLSPAPIGENAVAAGPAPRQKLAYVPRDYYYYNQAPVDAYFYRENGTVYISPTLSNYPSPNAHQAIGNAGEQWAAGIAALREDGVPVDSFRGETFVYEINGRQAPRVNIATFQEFFGERGAAAISTTGGSLPATALSAESLYSFYTALGKSLPTLADRAAIYEQYGLGPASFYVGTAEQNTRLLAQLKMR